MYPLNVILICSDREASPPLRRELINCSARLEAEFNGLGPAIEALRKSAAEKRLLILHMSSSEELDALARLKIEFPGWPVIAMVEGYDPKASLGMVVVGIMRAGASEILSLPVQSEEFQHALNRIASQFVYAVKDTKVIAVAGVTGGSGSTIVALNLAFEIADRHGLRCVMADLSLRMGVVALYLNIEPTFTILDLLGEGRRVDTFLSQQALIKVTDNLQLLAGPHKLVAHRATSTQDVARIVDSLKQVADVVVLDLPCTYDDIYFDTLANAGQVVLVGEQSLSSIRALKMVREALGRSSDTEHLVLNKYDPKCKGFEVRRLLKPLGVSSLRTVARDDLGMSIAIERSCTLRLASPRSPALADIVELADAALSIEAPLGKKSVGLFGRIGRALVNS